MVACLNVTCLSVSKDAGIVSHEGVVQQTLPKALEHYILACANIQKTDFNVSKIAT